MNEYTQRGAAWAARLTEQDRADHRYSNARLAVAAVAVALVVFRQWEWLIVPVAAFLVLVILHERNARRQELARRAIRYYQNGLARIRGEWAGQGNAGEAYRDPAHPYAEDLDLFGAGGLFELMCVARTQPGERRLAAWLMAPAGLEEVRERQEAVRELAGRLDLREDIALLGEDIQARIHPEPLAAWGVTPAVPVFAGARWVLLALGLLALGALAGWMLQQWPLTVFFGALLLVLPVARWMNGPVARMLQGLDARSKDLALVADLLARLEREPLEGAKLQALRGEIAGASAAIRRLRHLTDWLDSDRNALFALPAFCVLWRPQFALAIDRWRGEAGPHLGRWMAALAEFEALASVAAFAYEHPATVFPSLETSGRVFEATALAHPLLAEGRAVANDVPIRDAARLWMVSGSNMSGKSTLLRAVGLNTVLAWAGAPVRAQALRVSALQVGASMRVNDSLRDGRSRFYAEIQRLRQLVELAGAGERPLLFLIDEILSGTNSHDRRMGAEAILKGLLERGAMGLATTHDLALTKIPHAVNVHFEDKMTDGRLEFDYRLREGVVERSNAIELMRSVGLPV